MISMCVSIDRDHDISSIPADFYVRYHLLQADSTKTWPLALLLTELAINYLPVDDSPTAC